MLIGGVKAVCKDSCQRQYVTHVRVPFARLRHLVLGARLVVDDTGSIACLPFHKIMSLQPKGLCLRSYSFLQQTRRMRSFISIKYPHSQSKSPKNFKGKLWVLLLYVRRRHHVRFFYRTEAPDPLCLSGQRRWNTSTVVSLRR